MLYTSLFVSRHVGHVGWDPQEGFDVRIPRVLYVHRITFAALRFVTIITVTICKIIYNFVSTFLNIRCCTFLPGYSSDQIIVDSDQNIKKSIQVIHVFLTRL